MRSIPVQCAMLALVSSMAQAATVVEHANGYTLNAANELLRFSAMAFDDRGRIIAVGNAREVAAKAPGARHVDMHGKTVLPGLIDAHGHVQALGETLAQLDLTGSASLADALAAVAAYGLANPGQSWLRGHGWNQETWHLGRFPSAAELDGAAAARPVWLQRIDGHAGWANSRALQLAGIGDATPDPAGGRILRDADGKATGVLIDAAQELVERVLPKPSAAAARLALARALAQIARVGLTGVHDAGVDADQDRLYRDFADHGRLSTRIYGMIAGAGPDFDRLAAKGPLRDYADGHYQLRAVKLYADGALGSRGAALIAPYSDEPTSSGLLFHSDGTLRAMMNKAMRRGYQVNVHAIGDAANRQVIDAFAALSAQAGTRGTSGLRHRVEHAQLLAPDDIARFPALGLIASMQPIHATSDMHMAEQRVGAQRIEGAYAWHSFLEQGARIACGSDFPVESPNPFLGIHAAVTRQDGAGQPAGGWHPEQAMSLKQAVRCFTLDAAYAAHQERQAGSLEPGKWADFIVIDQDLFAVPASAIDKTRVLQTWVGGRQVYRAR